MSKPKDLYIYVGHINPVAAIPNLTGGVSRIIGKLKHRRGLVHVSANSAYKEYLMGNPATLKKCLKHENRK